MKQVQFQINGYKIQAEYEEALIEDVLLPFFQQLSVQAKVQQRRIIVYLAAPCGAGKSTLAAMIEQLSKEEATLLPIQALGMDGFHYHQSYLLEHSILRDGEEIPMKQVKGCPETFDFAKLEAAIQQVKDHDILWPIYDRRIHDVIEDGIPVRAPIVLIEGNYLLLEEEPWRRLAEYRDAAIFMEADLELLRKRLIQRKLMGGMPPHEAVKFCEGSDIRNAKRILSHRQAADLNLVYDGKLHQK